MGQTTDPQQPLEITTGMKVAIAVVLVMGLTSSRNDRDDHDATNFTSDPRPIIVRSSGEPIRFTQLGVAVTPSHGWSHLSIEHDAAPRRATFVNESHHAIATIAPFPFDAWPPAENGTLKSASGETVVYEMRLKDAVINESVHQDFKVQWLDGKDNTTSGFRYGRLTNDSVDLFITIVEHSSRGTSEDPIHTFCDSIRPIEETP